MKITSNFSVLSFLLLYSFCGRQSGKDLQPIQQSTAGLTLSLADTLAIPVDSVTKSSYYYDQFKIVASIPYYFVYNSSRYALQAYDLSGQGRNMITEFEKEGVNGIGEPMWFYYHNRDSIFFVYADNHTRISLYNSFGKRVSTWLLAFPGDYKDSWISLELFYRPEYDPKRKTIGFWLSNGYSDRLSYQKTLKQCRFHIKTEDYQFFGDIPDTFNDVNLYPNNYINGYSTDDFIVTYFNTAHEFHLYDKDSLSKVKKILAKSKFLPDSFEPLKESDDDKPDIQEESNYNATHGYYAKMISNEDYTYHYRIVKHPAELRYADGRRRNFHDRLFSVMVLDKDFKLIQEVEFPGGKFDFFHSFAWRDKLFLSLNNSMNEYASDDFMQFAVYEIK